MVTYGTCIQVIQVQVQVVVFVSSERESAFENRKLMSRSPEPGALKRELQGGCLRTVPGTVLYMHELRHIYFYDIESTK